MAKFNAEESKNYGGQGGGGFFSLKNDKDSAVVRFMYNTYDDVIGYSVHEAEVDGKKRYVNCIREYNEPLSACPFCEAGMKVLAKVFVPVYDVDSGEVKIWDRGKNFFAKLSGLCTRYSPLVSTPFEIERNGRAGDANTTYETFPQDKDDVTLEDLPEVPEVLGGLVLDKSFEELAEYVEVGAFRESEPKRAPAQERRPQANNGAVRRREMPAREQSEPRTTRRPMRTAKPADNEDAF